VADHRILVVGAASGIGRRTAELLAARGARVACFDRDATGAQRVAAALTRSAGGGPAVGGPAVGGRLDVTDPGSAAAAVTRVREEYGGLEAVVNCAGITGQTNRPSHEVDLADFDEVVRINLHGAFVLSQAVLPGLLAAGYGRLLHVASIAGKEGNAGMVAYSASKAGLIGMVKAMGKEYAETGVTVNALAPAVVRTPLVDALPEATVTYMTDKIPMRRCATLDEVAEMIAFIVSPAASFTTGFTFDLSGGRATY